MIQTILYHLSLYLFGYLFLFFLPRSAFLSIGIRHAMAFACGAMLWIIGGTVLLVTSIPVTIWSYYVVMVLLSLSPKLFWKKGAEAHYASELVWGGGALLVLVSLHFVIGEYWYFFVSPDSFMYYTIGDDIAYRGGILSFENWQGKTGARLTGIPLLLSGGLLHGLKYYPTLFCMGSASVLASIAGFIWYFSRENYSKPVSWLFVVVGGVLYATPPIVFMHTFYAHSNLYGGLFLSCGALLVVAMEENDQAVNVLSALFLACSTLVRIENLIFVIPILLAYLVKGQRPRLQHVFWGLFITLLSIWHVPRIFTFGMGKGLHGFGAGELASIFIFVFLWAGSWFNRGVFKLFRYGTTLSILFLSLFLAACSIVFTAEFVNCIKSFGLIVSSVGKVFYWGWAWIPILLCLPIAFVSKVDKRIRLLAAIILQFVLLRLAFYSTPFFPGLSHYSSGSRVLLSMYPAGVVLVVISLTLLCDYVKKTSVEVKIRFRI